jgi:hypothetical protein
MKKQIIATAIFSLLLFSCNQSSHQKGKEVSQEVAETSDSISNENQIPEELREDVEKAIAKVRALPEVANFLNEDKENSTVEFDHAEGDTLVIHVYRVVLEENGAGHTATFNWYQVNRKDGNIVPIF